jgi:lysyl-tRNA synthetase class 2
MTLKYQFQLIQAMRNFFIKEGFLDVLTPPMVQNPGMETHIHPFEVYSKAKKQSTSYYLHTSPEFMMKELLAKEEFEKIFTISYCFRDEPTSPIHRPQFVMCEWYRKNERYEKIMSDVENLIFSIQEELDSSINIQKQDFQKRTVQELFQEVLNIDILNYPDKEKLKEMILSDFKDVPIPDVDCSWDDYFFLLFLNKIEPKLKSYKALFIYEYPAPLSALSTLKETDPRVCERFELYINGIEICNCFNELTDYNIQKQRFSDQEEEKKETYQYSLPKPERFLNIIKKGYPPSSGIALGVERLHHALNGDSTIFFD